MDRIASFTINHLDLMPGLYVSRRDAKGDCVTTTFDLRITAPNREPVVDTPALHTIEHLAATYLRNSEKKDDVIYFGPMGCRTGCYLVMFGNLDSEDVLDLVLEMCDFIIGFEGEISAVLFIEIGTIGQPVFVAILKAPSLKGRRLNSSPLFLVPSGKIQIEIPFFT